MHGISMGSAWDQHDTHVLGAGLCTQLQLTVGGVLAHEPRKCDHRQATWIRIKEIKKELVLLFAEVLDQLKMH
jgi:hypothetical protein